MKVFILAAIVFGIMMAFLGLGLFFHRRCIRGTCAGARDAVVGPDGKTLACPRCERELDRETAEKNRVRQSDAEA